MMFPCTRDHYIALMIYDSVLENAILCGDEIRTAGQNIILTKIDWYYIVAILCGDVDNRVQPRTELSYKFAIEWYYISCSQRVLG